MPQHIHHPIWIATMSSIIPALSIFLYEGKQFEIPEKHGAPFCEVQVGSEFHKTTIATLVDPLKPLWMEEFDLYLHDASWKKLEITVWSSRIAGTKRDVVGKTSLDIAHLQCGKLEEIWLDLEDDGKLTGSIRLSLLIGKRSITADRIGDTVVAARRGGFLEKYHLSNTMNLGRLDSVGALIVQVYKATGLSKDRVGRKRDAFCSIRLVSVHVETGVERQTLDPEWNMAYAFPVLDVHSTLEVSVCEETDAQSHKGETLGRTFMRLTDIVNGQLRWFALKDPEDNTEDRGSVLMELEVIYNPVRAALRTTRRPPVWTDEPVHALSAKTFAANVERAKIAIDPLLDLDMVVRNILNWESPPLTILGLFCYTFLIWYVELWMVPLFILLFMLGNKRVKQSKFMLPTISNQKIENLVKDKDESEPKSKKKTDEPDSSIMHKLFVEIPDGVLAVQNGLEFAMDMYERANNVLQFNEPWISTFVCVILGIGTVVLYLVPMRIILLLYGWHKFTKKLRNPNSVGNNDLIAILSRARTNAEMRVVEEMEVLRDFRDASPMSDCSDLSFDSRDGQLVSNTHKREGTSSGSDHNIVGVKKMLKF